MDNNSHNNGNSNFMFDAISGIYSLFYARQKEKYGSALQSAEPFSNISDFTTALDVGCGTGALSDVLAHKGVSVTGIDNSKKMLEIAKKKSSHVNSKFLFHDASYPLPFADDMFDFSIASYVAHGLDPDTRAKMLKEMRRVSKHYVILHEYGKKRKLTTDVIEYLEGGNYFVFIKDIERELEGMFDEVKIVPVDHNALWYIAKA